MQLVLWGAIAVISVVLDNITKHLASSLAGGKTASFIPGIINFQYVENTGAAFGMMKGQRWLFITISSVAILAIIVFMIVNRKKMCALLGIGLAMIVGGGVGNQIDRIALGYVIDFIHFDFYFPVLEDFPTFNVADSFVTVGAVIVVIAVLFFEKNLFGDKKEISPNE